MLIDRQLHFRDSFLNPVKQQLYFLRQLPMAWLAGVRLITLDEEKAVATVPYKSRNKNPFKSMYFAVQSMAAELSTAAPAFLAINGCNFKVSLIIIKNEAVYTKKAKTKLRYTCTDYKLYETALQKLSNPGDTTQVTAKTIGLDANDEEVATFYFTWSFKRQ